MTDQAEESTDSGERKLYPWVIAGVIVLLMLAFVAYRGALLVLLKNEKAALRKKGYPVTLKELDESYTRVPRDENAALVYQEAFKARVQPAKEAEALLPIVGEAEEPPIGEGLSGEALAAARQHLSDNQRTLKLLHEAAGMDRSRYPVDFTQGLATPMVHGSKLRHAARLLRLEAVVHATDGESGQAAQSIIDILQSAGSLKNEPSLISQFVRMACQFEAIESFRQTAALTRMSRGELKRLAKAFKRAQDGAGRSMKRGMVASVTTILSIDDKDLRGFVGSGGLRSTTAGHLEGAWHITSFLLYELSGLADMDRMEIAGYVERVGGIFDRPPSGRLAAARSIEKNLRPSGTSAIGSSLHVLRGLALPAMSQTVEAHLQSLARLRSARGATAVERFRLDHGRLPKDLSELTSDYLDSVPTDPFDVKPLRYRATEKGYVIYSVGEDGKDDGGKSGDRHVQPDVTFTVKTPDREGTSRGD